MHFPGDPHEIISTPCLANLQDNNRNKMCFKFLNVQVVCDDDQWLASIVYCTFLVYG